MKKLFLCFAALLTATVMNLQAETMPSPRRQAMQFNRPAVSQRAAARKALPTSTQLTASAVQYNDYYGEYYMGMSDGSFFAFAGINPQQGVTYTLADMNGEYTGFYTDYEFTAATAATLKVDTKDGLPYVVGTMTLGGTAYTITYEVTITDTVTVNASDLTIKSQYYGGYSYKFSDADWTVEILISDATQKTGTFSTYDADYSYVYPTGGSAYYDSQNILDLKENIVVTQIADTTTLTGKVVAANGKFYILNARYEKPAPKQITLAADTMIFTMKFKAGWFKITGYNVDSTLNYSMYFYSKSLAGTYTKNDMETYYSTYVDEKQGKKTLASYSTVNAANIQVTYANNVATVTGTMNLATSAGLEAIVTVNMTSNLFPEPHTRTVTAGKFGTICVPEKIVGMTGVDGLYIPYEKTDDMLYCEEVALGDVLAGGSYIFLANAAEVRFELEPCYKAALDTNYMKGWLSDDYNLVAADVEADGDFEGMYFLGTLQGEDEQKIIAPMATSTIKKNRAMIKLNDVPAQAAAPARGRTISFGVNGTTTPTGMVNVNATRMSDVHKFVNNGQLIIIRNGVSYNISGQMIK